MSELFDNMTFQRKKIIQWLTTIIFFLLNKMQRGREIIFLPFFWVFFLGGKYILSHFYSKVFGHSEVFLGRFSIFFMGWYLFFSGWDLRFWRYSFIYDGRNFVFLIGQIYFFVGCNLDFCSLIQIFLITQFSRFNLVLF